MSSIAGLVAYLHTLAPSFFEEQMRGASPGEIARLEEAAGTRHTVSHRDFLYAFGGTPAQALNPFLNDRDYCVETLVKEYADLHEAGESLPSGVVYFSSSSILGEYIFLRHGRSLDIEPDIGDIDFETGQFVTREIGRFESWLWWFAFKFRLAQPEIEIELIPPWDRTEQRWLGEPEICWELLEGMGLKLVFSLENGTRCADRGDVAAIIHPDGSGSLAGDDFVELEKIQDVLREHLDVSLKPKPQSRRLRAPRE
jgi:hypothetical protein